MVYVWELVVLSVHFLGERMMLTFLATILSPTSLGFILLALYLIVSYVDA